MKRRFRSTSRSSSPMRPRRRDGFTLISVMMAVMLLTVGLFALGRTQTVLLGAQATAASQTSSLSVARAYMEEVRARDPWVLVDESVTNVSLDGLVDGDGPLRRSLAVDVAQDNLLRVTVTVAGTRNDKPVELVTYVYRGAR